MAIPAVILENLAQMLEGHIKGSPHQCKGVQYGHVYTSIDSYV